MSAGPRSPPERQASWCQLLGSGAGPDADRGQRGRRERVATVDTDPADGHGDAEAHHDREVGERDPGQHVVVGDEIRHPHAEPAEREQGVPGDDRHGQARRRRALEVGVVLDQPDCQQEEPAEHGDNPRNESSNGHR